ncbi:hypothetical protein [Streptomyces sp. NPDC093094]
MRRRRLGAARQQQEQRAGRARPGDGVVLTPAGVPAGRAAGLVAGPGR